MRKVAFIALALFVAPALIFAGTTAKAVEKKADVQVVTINGTIIDNKCAEGNSQDLGNFIKTHTKDCALMKQCAASGYSIYSDGKLTKFDKRSNKKIEAFLKKKASKLDVVVKAEKVGDELKLKSIENQK